MSYTRPFASLLLASSLAGCAGLSLTGPQQAALNSLLSSAGLNVQVSDTSGNQVPLSAGSVSSVSYNGTSLSPSQFNVGANGALTFKDVVKPNSGKVPVVITLTDGSVLRTTFDTATGALGSNTAQFVPGDDGKFHLGDPGRSLHANWQAQHQSDMQQHWATIQLGLTDLASPDPKTLLAVRPGGQTTAFLLPSGFVQTDASGDLLVDSQVFNLAAPPPAPPLGQPSPARGEGAAEGQAGMGGEGMGGEGMGEGAMPRPPAPPTSAQIASASFIVAYASASGSVETLTFQVHKANLQVPDLALDQLPAPQTILPSDITIVATASYPTFAAATTAEGIPATAPPPARRPILDWSETATQSAGG